MATVKKSTTSTTAAQKAAGIKANPKHLAFEARVTETLDARDGIQLKLTALAVEGRKIYSTEDDARDGFRRAYAATVTNLAKAKDAAKLKGDARAKAEKALASGIATRAAEMLAVWRASKGKVDDLPLGQAAKAARAAGAGSQKNAGKERAPRQPTADKPPTMIQALALLESAHKAIVLACGDDKARLEIAAELYDAMLEYTGRLAQTK